MRTPYPPSRRAFLALTAALAPARALRPAHAQARRKVAALFAGRIDDGGFMEAGYRGLVTARDRFGVEIAWRDKIRPERDLLAAALRELAAGGPALVVAHGGQNNEAAKLVAAEFPAVAFAVTQGSVAGPNLASYEVRQEESALVDRPAHLSPLGQQSKVHAWCVPLSNNRAPKISLAEAMPSSTPLTIRCVSGEWMPGE